MLLERTPVAAKTHRPEGARLQERVAVRQRPGRRFLPSEELELGAVLRDLACRLPGASSGVMVISEMTGPAGLPDLVAVPLTQKLEDRLALPCPPLLAFGDVRLVAACSSLRPSSLKVLSRRLEVPEDAIRRRSRRLERHGALVGASGGWLRSRELQPVGRLYALEAKVDDWGAGLGQALRYGSWADASAAVMARLPRDPSRAVTQARQLGLGLAHGPRWLVRPTVGRLSTAQRLWASEHVIAAIRPS